jgi:hypothetical protein
MENQPPPRRRFRWLKRIFLGLAILVVLALAVRASVVYLAEREFRMAAAELDRSDPGWRLEDIEKQRAVVLPERNAALPITAAGERLASWWPPSWELHKRRVGEEEPESIGPERVVYKLAPNKRLSEDLAGKLRGLMSAQNATLLLARKVIDLPTGRYDVSWPSDRFEHHIPHLDHVTNVAELLEADGVLRADDGDYDGALGSVRGMLNAGRSVGDEPYLISQMHRKARGVYAVHTLERVLGQGEPSVKELRITEQLFDLEEEEVRSAFILALKGARALDVRTMEEFCTGERLPFELKFRRRPMRDLTLFMQWLYYRPAWSCKRAPALRCTTRFIQLAPQPRRERAAALAELRQQMPQLGDYIPRLGAWSLAAPDVGRVLDFADRDLAILRCGCAAIAVERFRREKGRWPQTLDELVPEFLQQVPLDPFKDEPLRLGHVKDGVVIYSVGPDGEDNNGSINRMEEWDKPGTDLGLRLWNPDRRGLLPDQIP